MLRPIRASEVAGIVAVDEPVLRNLWITTAYHDLATGMAGLLGGANVSWPAFATWASKTAGASIRGEELPRLFVELLLASKTAKRFLEALGRDGGAGLTTHAHGLVGVIEASLADVSVIIARGNLSVFEELGPPFGRMITTFEGATSCDPSRRDQFLATVQALGDNVEATVRLRRAFAAYHAAMFESDAKTKADLILLANGLCGLTEQMRLQPTIEAALDAPVKDAVQRLAGGVLDALGLHGFARAAAQELLTLAMPELERIGHAIVTAHMMQLALPGETLLLSQDVPVLADGREFPANLVKLEQAELRAFFATYDRTNGTGRHSGAHDWADLNDRMDYIVNLFRARQEQAALLGEPFTAEQIAAMQAGCVPAGAL